MQGTETERLTHLVRLVQASGYAFVTPTPLTHARVVARPGRAWARDLRDVFGWSLPFHPHVLPSGIMEAMRKADVLAPSGDGWRSLVRMASLEGSTFLHSAYPTEAADSVFFGPDTYRFAQSILRVLGSSVKIGRAVDVGCGAGPGAVLMARAHPGAEVLGVDINHAALRLTRANAALAGVAVSVVHSDLLTGVEGDFDLIVANPPYMADPAARAYRDGGGALGAALSLRILETAIERLAPGGTVLLYTGAAIVDGVDPFHDAAGAVLRGSGLAWRYRELDPDVFGEELEGGAYAAADRIAAVELIARKG